MFLRLDPSSPVPGRDEMSSFFIDSFELVNGVFVSIGVSDFLGGLPNIGLEPNEAPSLT